MSTATAEYHFAAEFVTVVVAAAGLVLVGLRGRAAAPRLEARAALLAGFAATGTAAFLAGGLLVSPSSGALAAARIGGAVLLAVGSALGWGGGVGTRTLLQGGAGAAAAAGLAELAGVTGVFTDSLLVASGVAVGAALIGASRLAVAARVAAASALTLLAVVLVLSVALGAVITASAQRDELALATSRARTEGAQIAGLSGSSIKDARFVAADLAAFFRASNPDPLVDAAGGPGASAAAAPISQRLSAIEGLYPSGGLAYLAPGGAVLASTPGTSVAGARAVAADPALGGAGCGGGGNASALVAEGTAWEAATYPECLAGSGRLLGTVVTFSPIDAAYLDGLRSDSDPASVAVAVPSGVLAQAGPALPASVLETLARRCEATGAFAANTGGRLVSAEPLADAAGRPVASLVVSLPGSTLTATRDQLLRTLFLIALGGTVLALVLAAIVGDRITAGIRSLTGAARRVQAGDTATRAGVGGSDEIGVLGSAFDAMVVAIEDQTVALSSAAEDEARLRDRLEAVVAGMGEALVATDFSGRITDFNRAAEELTGVPAASALGAPVMEVLALDAADGVPLGPRLGRPGPGHWSLTASLHPRSGPEIPVAVSAGALRGPAGEVAGSVLVLRDLRREREVERMKNEFLSRVGHELRTPLTGILGYADLLTRPGVPPEKARGWHAEILASAKRLVRVVEMLEFFASAGAGRVLVRPEALDVGALVDGVAARWRSRTPPAVRVVASVEGTPPPVLADRRWLGLAVDELIDNAVKFSPGGGEVGLSVAGSGEGGGAWVEISVSDGGKGMTPEERAQAFGEFVQGDSSDTRSFGGLGLGLPLVQRVVADQGGTVRCTSTPGRGSVFTLRLPAVSPH